MKALFREDIYGLKDMSDNFSALVGWASQVLILTPQPRLGDLQ